MNEQEKLQKEVDDLKEANKQLVKDNQVAEAKVQEMIRQQYRD